MNEVAFVTRTLLDFATAWLSFQEGAHKRVEDCIADAQLMPPQTLEEVLGEAFGLLFRQVSHEEYMFGPTYLFRRLLGFTCILCGCRVNNLKRPARLHSMYEHEEFLELFEEFDPLDLFVPFGIARPSFLKRARGVHKEGDFFGQSWPIRRSPKVFPTCPVTRDTQNA